jgi:TIR domain
MLESNERAFVSYSRKDAYYLPHLEAILEEYGIIMDYDRNLRADESFIDQLENMIKRSKIVIMLFTKNALESDWVKREVKYARDEGITVLPLQLQDEELNWIAITDTTYYRTDEYLFPEKGFFVKLMEAFGIEFDYDKLKEFTPQDIKTVTMLIRDEEKRLREKGKKMYRCHNCKYPVTYDSLSLIAIILLLGVPAIGCTVIQFLFGWIAAGIGGVVALLLIWGAIVQFEDQLKEPSVCPHCDELLKKPLEEF